MPDAVSASEGVNPDAMVRHWRTAIITIAFALPVVSLVVGQATVAYPDGALATWYLRLLGVSRSELLPFKMEYVYREIPFLPLAVVVMNWPLLVFAGRIKHHIGRHWPDVVAVRASLIGATIGVLVPYVCFFALLPSDSLAHAGAGVSILAPLIWLIGWLFELAGLKVGALVVRLTA